MDSVNTLLIGLGAMVQSDPEAMRNNFRRGQVYNNDSRGLHCGRNPPQPWVHGPAAMKHFREVSACERVDLYGPRQTSDGAMETGWHAEYEVMMQTSC